MSDAPQQDRILDHEYDGIREYDNPMPRWWLATLWGTIIFSVLYVLNVPVVGKGPGRIAAYVADSTRRAEAAAANDPLAQVTPEVLASAAGDPARVEAGRTAFTANCAACHAADGGGGIGPNLTDDYWIHGASPMDVFNTVRHGVPDKGMPTWGTILPPDQVIAVAAYVTTLHGTHPAAPKEPQGTRDSAAAGP